MVYDWCQIESFNVCFENFCRMIYWEKVKTEKRFCSDATHAGWFYRMRSAGPKPRQVLVKIPNLQKIWGKHLTCIWDLLAFLRWNRTTAKIWQHWTLACLSCVLLEVEYTCTLMTLTNTTWKAITARLDNDR